MGELECSGEAGLSPRVDVIAIGCVTGISSKDRHTH